MLLITSRVPMRRLRRAGSLAGILALVVLVVPTVVRAHAELVVADPLPNAVLVSAPEALSITFSEAIDPASVSIEILDARLRSQPGMGSIDVDAAGTSLRVDLPELEPDVYTVRYTVVSTVDGHATSGSFAFVIDPTGLQAPPTVDPVSSSPSADAWAVAARWASLVATLVALGSLITWWRGGRRLGFGPPWRFVGGAILVGLVALIAYLVLSARPIPADARTGLPLDPLAPFGWTPFAIAMRVAIITGALALVGAVMSAMRPGAAGRRAVVTGVLLLFSIGGMSAAGHAAVLGGPFNAAIDWLHLVAAAAWLGGLPAVFVLARATPPGDRRHVTAELLRGHGRIALVAAPLVVLTGLTNSPLVLGAARGLVASEYGNLLVAKAVLASVALGIGAANHLLLRGRGRGPAGILVATELTIAAVAVMAAATMVTIQPAAARQDVLVGPAIQPFHYYGEAGPSSVHATVSVPAPGDQAYQVTLRDVSTGAPRDDVQRVFLAFDPPDGSGLTPERVELGPRAFAGLYATEGAYTPVVGNWTIEVVVRREGARDESTSFGLTIQEPSPPIVAPPPATGLAVPGPLAMLWGVLPGGLLGWLPAAMALAAVAGLGMAGARSRWLRVPLAGLAVILFLAAGSRAFVEAANQPSPAELAPYAVPFDGDPEAGRRIYLANCAACHGQDGGGDGPVRTAVPAEPLAEVLPNLSDAEVSYRIANGVAGTPMPAFAAVLTERERGDLVTYLRERWGAP